MEAGEVGVDSYARRSGEVSRKYGRWLSWSTRLREEGEGRLDSGGIGWRGRLVSSEPGDSAAQCWSRVFVVYKEDVE